MRMPRITPKILDGLATLAGVAEAGGPADILGYDEDSSFFDKEAWDNICVACSWIRKVQLAKQQGVSE